MHYKWEICSGAFYHIMPCYHSTIALLLLLGVTINLVLLMDHPPLHEGPSKVVLSALSWIGVETLDFV